MTIVPSRYDRGRKRRGGLNMGIKHVNGDTSYPKFSGVRGSTFLVKTPAGWAYYSLDWYKRDESDAGGLVVRQATEFYETDKAATMRFLEVLRAAGVPV